MAKKKIDFDKYAEGLFARTEQYAEKVRKHYALAVDELLKIADKGKISENGGFSYSKSKRLSGKANGVLRGLYSAVYNEIKNGVKAEWQLANISCDALIESIFGKRIKADDHFARWFSRNQEAVDAFFNRKSAYGGLNLSQRVWKYTGDLKTEMELALTLSIGEGKSAATISREVRHLLQNPDKLFRRVRTGTDENGNPIYQLSKAAKAYHPGRGVYRSSYKNAMRLTRTETNMAYRTSEQDRWQRMDFVLGYEVKLSNNHPDPDICNDLKGKYPKDFKFNGWHPQCRCYVVPILAEQDEFIEAQKHLLEGGSDEDVQFTGHINRPPKEFYKWLRDNKDRMESASNMPYWVQDNYDYINGKKAHSKSFAQREAIREKWAQRAKANQRVLKMASNVIKVAMNYPEIDVTSLQMYVDNKDIANAKKAAQSAAKQLVAVRNDEKALSALIPDVHDWKKQFTSDELHVVFDNVQKKLDSFATLSLEAQEKKLNFEAYTFLGGNMNNVQNKYTTWKVAQAAYIKQHKVILDKLEWKAIDEVLAEAKTFTTKSKPYLEMVSKLEDAIALHNKQDAQSIIQSMEAKRIALKKAAEARQRKALQTKFGNGKDLYAGGTPFTAQELAKLKDYETNIIKGIMNGNVDSYLIEQYNDFAMQVSEKYYDKQISQFAKQELDEMFKAKTNYLARPSENPNFIWGADLGGVYNGGYHDKITQYMPKVKGVTFEDLTIVQRFTNGSTFSNSYNWRKKSPYWEGIWNSKMNKLYAPSEMQEQMDIIEEWSKGANYVLDKMPRYNGITFRGLKADGGPELRANLLNAFKSGKPWVNEASCSTSIKHSVASVFDGDTILIVHNKTGAYIHPISEYTSEYEVMTLRGTKYKVLAPPVFVPSFNRYYVEIEEII